MKKNKPAKPAAPTHQDVAAQLGLRPGQSLELLKALHILTREGKLNQDSRRKLKQVYHLYQFIAPLLEELSANDHPVTLADHGAGKSYLGFILYDLFFKNLCRGSIYGIETRAPLVQASQQLAVDLGFDRMQFLNMSVADSTRADFMPEREMLQAAIDHSQEKVTGTVRLKLYKGGVHVIGRKSPFTLYSEKVVTFEDDAGAYDQRDAAGFIKLNALRLRLLGRRDGR